MMSEPGAKLAELILVFETYEVLRASLAGLSGVDSKLSLYSSGFSSLAQNGLIEMKLLDTVF